MDKQTKIIIGVALAGVAAFVLYKNKGWLSGKVSTLFEKDTSNIPFRDLTDTQQVGSNLTNDEKLAYIAQNTNPEDFAHLKYGEGLGAYSLGLNPFRRVQSLMCAKERLNAKYPDRDWDEWEETQLKADYILVRCLKDEENCSEHPLVVSTKAKALEFEDPSIIAAAIKPCSPARDKSITNNSWD